MKQQLLDVFFFSDLLVLAKKYAKIAGTIGVIGIVGFGYLISCTSPSFRSEALLQHTQQESGSINQSSAILRMLLDDDAVQYPKAMFAMNSTSFLEKLIYAHGLQVTTPFVYKLVGKTLEPTFFKQVKYDAPYPTDFEIRFLSRNQYELKGISQDQLEVDYSKLPTTLELNRTYHFRLIPMQQAIRRIQKKFLIAPLKKEPSYTRLSLVLPDPVFAQEVLKDAIEKYCLSIETKAKEASIEEIAYLNERKIAIYQEYQQFVEHFAAIQKEKGYGIYGHHPQELVQYYKQNIEQIEKELIPLQLEKQTLTQHSVEEYLATSYPFAQEMKRSLEGLKQEPIFPNASEANVLQVHLPSVMKKPIYPYLSAERAVALYDENLSKFKELEEKITHYEAAYKRLQHSLFSLGSIEGVLTDKRSQVLIQELIQLQDQLQEKRYLPQEVMLFEVKKQQVCTTLAKHIQEEIALFKQQLEEDAKAMRAQKEAILFDSLQQKKREGDVLYTMGLSRLKIVTKQIVALEDRKQNLLMMMEIFPDLWKKKFLFETDAKLNEGVLKQITEALESKRLKHELMQLPVQIIDPATYEPQQLSKQMFLLLLGLGLFEVLLYLFILSCILLRKGPLELAQTLEKIGCQTFQIKSPFLGYEMGRYQKCALVVSQEETAIQVVQQIAQQEQKCTIFDLHAHKKLEQVANESAHLTYVSLQLEENKQAAQLLNASAHKRYEYFLETTQTLVFIAIAKDTTPWKDALYELCDKVFLEASHSHVALNAQFLKFSKKGVFLVD